MNFDQAQKLFRDRRIQDLAATPAGLRYLKLKSLSRADHLIRLFGFAQVVPTSSGVRALFREAFENKAIDARTIEAAIRVLYDEGRRERRDREPQLVSNLYRLTAFDWGGLHQNSLEMTIVDNYVKKDHGL